jgi:hypothetical protein
MATNQVTGPYPPFEYGASVRWRRDAGKVLEGSICGFREIFDAAPAIATELPIGTVLVLVELQSGESVEIPISELELI